MGLVLWMNGLMSEWTIEQCVNEWVDECTSKITFRPDFDVNVRAGRLKRGYTALHLAADRQPTDASAQTCIDVLLGIQLFKVLLDIYRKMKVTILGLFINKTKAIYKSADWAKNFNTLLIICFHAHYLLNQTCFFHSVLSPIDYFFISH